MISTFFHNVGRHHVLLGPLGNLELNSTLYPAVNDFFLWRLDT